MQPGTDEVMFFVRDGDIVVSKRSRVRGLEVAPGDLPWDYSRSEPDAAGDDLSVNRRSA